MGTRIHVFLKHDLRRFDDPAATVARLEGSLPAALAIRDYWRSIERKSHQTDERWEAEPATPGMPNIRDYTGPGSLFLTVTPEAALVSTGGRWRGFLSIEPLRRVHLEGFRAIARALGSPRIAICADSRDDVTDVFLANGSQDACIAAMRSAMGTPQSSVELVAPELITQAEHRVPDVWFVEDQPVAG